jgi:uncharacterized protein YjiS (DUF1127 family)
MIGYIKNIRFTYQWGLARYSIVQGKWVGIPGGSAATRRPNRVPSGLNSERAMPAITALTVSAATPVARALAMLAARAGRRLKQLAEKVKNRHHAMRLAELDDRMLADIGLSRSDLRDAYALPLWRDPSDVLVRRAADRRGRRSRTQSNCVPVATVSTELFGTSPAPCHR